MAPEILEPATPPALSGQLSNMPGEQPFAFNLEAYPSENSVALARPNQYDYAPSVMATPDGKLKMWFCGGGGTGAHRGDSIWYSENSQQGDPASWSPPVEVVRPSDNPAYLDYAHACDPSVVRNGDYDYVFYTGATDWAPNGGSCNGSPTADGCNNLGFVARVPGTETANPASYQKPVNVGECMEPNCFDWRSFQRGLPEYPPVPVIRGPGEQAPVWRRAGTGNVGTTTQQTQAYGIGQPSAVNTDGHIRTWYTSITEAGAAENLVVKPADNMKDAFAAQDQQAYTQHIPSNLGNEVNYDVAFDPKTDHYLVTVAEEREPGNPLGRPRIGVSQYTGEDTTNFVAPIMSNGLSVNTGPTAGNWAAGTETNTHNSGFLRDPYGYLTSLPGSDNVAYGRIYYGTNRSRMEAADIGWTAFRLVSLS